MKLKNAFLLGILVCIFTGLTAGFAGGSGVKSDPYEIDNCAQLENISSDLAASYELVSDIDCSSYSSFTEISSEKTGNFVGSLNGRNHTINGLTLDYPDDYNVALFTGTSTAVIKNIGLENIDYNVQSGASLIATDYGSSNGPSTNVTNVYSTGVITSNGDDLHGLFGDYTVGINATRVYAIVEMDLGTDDYNAGYGLIGRGGAPVSESFAAPTFSGDVTGAYGDKRGGFSSDVGDDRNVSNSYWDKELSGAPRGESGIGLSTNNMTGLACGMVGFDQSNWVFKTGEYPQLENFASGGISGNCAPAKKYIRANNPLDGEDVLWRSPKLNVTVGDRNGDSLNVEFYDASDDTQIGSTQTGIESQGTASVEWQNLERGQTHEWYVEVSDGTETTKSDIFNFTVNTMSGGNGTSSVPYKIGNCQHLQNIDINTSAHYELESDIDCSVTQSWNSGRGFQRIANDSYSLEGNAFRGVLDGKGFKIKDLYMNRGSYDAAIFDWIHPDGVVKNLGVVDVNITTPNVYDGSHSVISNVNEGLINDSYTTGNIVGSSASGLVGSNEGKIVRSFSNATVESVDPGYGTAVGLAGNQGKIVQSYFDGNASSQSGEAAGIALSNDGKITDSYSTGTVFGNQSAGGAIHSHFNWTIETSFATKVSGGSTGGLVFEESYSSPALPDSDDSYWDVGQSGTSSSAFGSGLSTSEMKGGDAVCNLRGFDFQNTWDAKSGDYPELQAFNSGSSVDIDSLSCSPSRPENPSPTLTGSSSVTLSVKVFDPDSDSMDVTFRNASDDSKIGSVQYDVPSRGTASTIWNEVGLGENKWYAEVDDGEGQNQSRTFSFYRFPGGSGTEADPYHIKTCRDLQTMNKGVLSNYELISDVDCSVTENWNYNSTEGRYRGFKPIADTYYDFRSFRGSLDGNGHAIENLYINRSRRAGLFGMIGSDDYPGTGVVRNLGVKDIKFAAGSSSTGPIAATNYGNITKVFASGSIYPGNSDFNYVGGLVDTSYGYIGQSYSTVKLRGNFSSSNTLHREAAGIVRRKGTGSSTPGVVEESFFAGTLKANEVHNLFGALTSASLANNTFSTGRAIGNGEANPVGRTVDNGEIRNGYNVGRVKNISDSAIVSAWHRSEYGDSVDGYWNNETTGREQGLAGIELSDSDMMGEAAASNMAFDFDNVWTTTHSYPKFQWMEPGNGTEEAPYKIYDCYDLQEMDNNLTANYILANDVDCSVAEYWNSGKGFNPAGSTGSPFTGKLDGQGYEVRNLFIDRSEDEVGLFGYLQGATVQNMSLGQVNISGNSNVGAVAGLIDAGTSIENTYVNGTLVGSGSKIGGLTGETDASILEQSYSISDLNGGSKVGGLAGIDSGLQSILNQSYSASTVSGSNIGGIISEKNSVKNESIYWDDQKGPSSSPIGNDLNTSEMQGCSSMNLMKGFDFNFVWNARSSGYPVFRWNGIDNTNCNVVLNWTSESNADGFKIYGNSSGSFQEIADVNQASNVGDSLEKQIDYSGSGLVCYRITAYVKPYSGTFLESSPSAEVCRNW